MEESYSEALDLESDEELAHRPGRVLRDWILVVAIALGAALLVRVYVLQQFYISGEMTALTGGFTVVVEHAAAAGKFSFLLDPPLKFLALNTSLLQPL